ncbi:hypothetical protein COA17_09465 [Sphingomonas ginsenosidimutans]|jgi:PST family polysaccharide transporter|uniref:Polysaccharide biosynthesis protein n=1 Tax=Sphingomonas ginsenosidimutans TaxID=862134 RepID=A0A2A4HXL4_9SPHN|nr:oligosaccharide flippase family protein [Sphingomonas ginsenosidimutans]MEE2915778.1 oligosaccharide flippase family protein [Pseudomonadota bacterium]PCG09110.1 hypothetical protein COA17_09465 [Sphingomonas ginsenosidimutans]
MRHFLLRPGLHNLAALTVIQGSNALIPLLIVPFAIATVGAGAYAQVAITEAISALVLAAVLYSFDVDGVARLSRTGRDATAEQRGAILAEILLARLAMFVLVAPLTIGVYRLAGGQRPLLLAFWLLVPLGHIFHAYWFYQAIERNVPPAAITLGSRVVTLAIVFGAVRGPADAALIPLAIGGPFVLGGLVSTLYIVLRLHIPLRSVHIGPIIDGLRHGKAVFAGNVAVSLYREMNVVILGVLGVPAAGISTYALVEKSIKMLQAVTRPLNQFYFPKVLGALSGHAAPDRTVARLIGRYTVPQLGAVLALIVALPAAYGLAAGLSPRLATLGALPGVWTMSAIMAPAMLFGIANFMFGTAGLNALGQRGYLFLAIVATGTASVAGCFALGAALGAMGAAICFVLAEAMLFALVIARYLVTPVDPRKGRA